MPSIFAIPELNEVFMGRYSHTRFYTYEYEGAVDNNLRQSGSTAFQGISDHARSRCYVTLLPDYRASCYDIS